MSHFLNESSNGSERLVTSRQVRRQEKKYQCAECGSAKNFVTTNDLDRHMKTVHAILNKGDRIYICHIDNCSASAKIWPRLDNFKHHVSLMHGEQYADRAEDMWQEYEPEKHCRLRARSRAKGRLNTVATPSLSHGIASSRLLQRAVPLSLTQSEAAGDDGSRQMQTLSLPEPHEVFTGASLSQYYPYNSNPKRSTTGKWADSKQSYGGDDWADDGGDEEPSTHSKFYNEPMFHTLSSFGQSMEDFLTNPGDSILLNRADLRYSAVKPNFSFFENDTGKDHIYGPVEVDGIATLGDHYTPENNLGKGHIYDKVEIKDNATAVMGDYYNQQIQEIHYHNEVHATAINARFPTRVERQNEVFPFHTLETITTFQEGGPFSGRGTSSKTAVKWLRAEDIGEGVFGEVHRETQHDNNTFPKSRAVKVMRRRQLTRMKIDYKRELGALMQLARGDYNQHFVEFFAWYENNDNIFIAMEYIPGGDLSKHIGDGILKADTQVIASQILEGICILHRLGIVHRDIKPANIFVATTSPSWWVKIGDFGICKNTITRNTALRTNVGTYGYQAPEVIGLVSARKGNEYDARCDIWSFACLFHEIWTGKAPFADLGALIAFCDSDHQGRRQNLFGTLPLSKHSLGVLEAITEQLLQPDPHQRLTAEEALHLVEEWASSSPKDERKNQGSRHPPGNRSR